MGTMFASLHTDKLEVVGFSIMNLVQKFSCMLLHIYLGKTYTMEGDESGIQEGIIPKTIKKIFEQTNALEEKSWKYTLSASFLEIYNEEIRDLLATEKGLKYDIKKVDAKSSEIYVTNIKSEDVTCGNNIQSLLKRAKKNRAVAATNCNERSSRSHSVFMLKIVGKNSITSESCTGTLNLVDLAGSERYEIIFKHT